MRFIRPLGASIGLVLAACGDGSDTVPTGTAGVGGEGGVGFVDATASTGNVSSSPTGSGGVGGADPGPTTSSSTTATSSSTSSGEVEDLEALLARLRADPEGTVLQESLEAGWPVRVEEGRVVAILDSDFDQVAGDFDDWVGTPATADAGFSWALVPDEAGSRYKLKSGETFEPDPWARAYEYDEFGEITFVAPPAAAHLERWPLVESDLAPRTVRAWVPAEAATRVLYVHDGQNLFDPGAFFGGWRLQEAAPPGMLLVGIDNTPDRMDEYTHVPDDIGSGPLGGQGDAYAAFLGDVVRPLVEARYGEPPVVGTMGSSLGGLISLHVALLDPDTYAFAASLSGTLGWGSIGAEEETMIQRYQGAGHQPIAIYLDSGGGGDTCDDADGDGTNDDDDSARDNYCETLQMRDALVDLGWEIDVDLAHRWEPGATHDEAAWAARVDVPLAMFAEVEAAGSP